MPLLTAETIFGRTEQRLNTAALDSVLRSLLSGGAFISSTMDLQRQRKLFPHMAERAYHAVTAIFIPGYYANENMNRIHLLRQRYVAEKLDKFCDDPSAVLTRYKLSPEDPLVFRAISHLEDACLALALAVPRVWSEAPYAFDRMTIQGDFDALGPLGEDIQRVPLSDVPSLLAQRNPRVHEFFYEQHVDSSDPIVIMDILPHKRSVPVDANVPGLVCDGKKRLLMLAVQGHTQIPRAYIGKEWEWLENMEHSMKQAAKYFLRPVHS